MKPLELTIYPKSRGMFGAQYDLPGGRHMLARDGADVMSRNKRLTDAELAAEFWNANAIAWDVVANRGRGVARLDEQCDVLERFATLPHYDEVSL